MKIRLGAPLLFLLESKCPTVKSFSLHGSEAARKRYYYASTTAVQRFPPRGGGVDGDRGDCSQPITYASHGKEFKSYSTSLRATTETVVDEYTDPSLDTEIINAAMNSIEITGPSLHTSTFGNMQYINTEKLNSSNQKQHRVLFILGGPGAGKGTQSARIVDHYKCIHLSVGELLREERTRKSPHSELIEECLVAGKIVPVEISLSLVRKAMDEIYSSKPGDEKDETQYGNRIFLVDGFPRNWANLAGWTSEMPNYAAVIGSLVYDCPIDILEKRILSRAETSGRSDDNLESARKRFRTFQQETMPVVNALEHVERMQINQSEEGISKLHIQHITGDGTVEEVWDETKSIMNNFVTNDVLTANDKLLRAVENRSLDDYHSVCSMKISTSNKDNALDMDLGNEMDVEEVFQKYEVDALISESGRIHNDINNVDVNIQDGTKAIVSYDRTMKNEDGEVIQVFREIRVWSHEKKGWSCIHFYRKSSIKENQQP